jgi:hypothetical protein
MLSIVEQIKVAIGVQMQLLVQLHSKPYTITVCPVCDPQHYTAFYL